MNMNKIEALAKHFQVDIDDIDDNDEDNYDVAGVEYLVLTDDEADAKVREYIERDLWCFNSDFLAAHCNIDAKTIQLLQRNYEDSNETIQQSIQDFDHFVDDAIGADGRGHFLNTYDGEEIEIDTGLPGERWLYAYRM